MPSLLKVYTLPLIAAKRNGALDKQLDLASLAGFGVYTSTLKRGVHPKIALQVAIKTGANVPNVAKMARKYASSQFTLNPEEKDDLALKTGIKLLSTSVRNNLTGIPMYARNNIMSEIQNLLSFAAAFENVFAINPKNKKLKGKGSFNNWVTKKPLYGGAGGDEEPAVDTSSSGREEQSQDGAVGGEPHKEVNQRSLEENLQDAAEEMSYWSSIKNLARKIGNTAKSYMPSGKQWLGTLLTAMLATTGGIGIYNRMRPSTTPILDNNTLIPGTFPQNGTLFRYNQGVPTFPQNGTLFEYDQRVPGLFFHTQPQEWARFYNETMANDRPVAPEALKNVVEEYLTLKKLHEKGEEDYMDLMGEKNTAQRQNEDLRKALEEAQANSTNITNRYEQTEGSLNQLAREHVAQNEQIANLTRTIEEYEDEIKNLKGELAKQNPDPVTIEEIPTHSFLGIPYNPSYEEVWGSKNPWDVVTDGTLFNIPDDWVKDLSAEKDKIVRWRKFGEHVREAKARKWTLKESDDFDRGMKVVKGGMNADEINAYDAGEAIAEADITAKGNDTYQPPPGWWDKYGNFVMEAGKVLTSGVLFPFVTSWAVSKRIKDGINNGESAHDIEAGIQRIAMGSQALQNLANIAAKAKMEGVRYDKEFQHQRMLQRYELAKRTVERANAKRNAIISAATAAIPIAIGGVPGAIASLASGVGNTLSGLFGNQAAAPPAPGDLPRAPAPGGPGVPPAQGPLGAQINHPLLRPIDADVGAAVLDPGAAPGGPLVAPGGPAAQRGRRRANRDRKQIRENLITFSDLILTDAEWNQIKNELFAGTTIRDVDEAKNTGLNTFRSLAMDAADMPGAITNGLTGYYNDHRVDQAIRTRNRNRIAANLAVILGRLPYYIDRTVRYIEAMEAGDENAAATVAASQKKEGKSFVENFGKISQMINALNPTIKQLTEAYKPQTPYLLKPFELPKSQFTSEPIKAPTVADLFGKEITIYPQQEAIPQYDYVEQVSAIPYGTARHLSTNVQPVNMQAAKRPRSATNSNSTPKRKRGNRGNWSSLE